MIKFWYATSVVGQHALDGRVVNKTVPVGEGHIVYNDALLCGQGTDKLEVQYNASKHKTVQNRIESLPLCKQCEEAYKSNPSLDWQRWIKSVETPRDVSLVR